MEILSLSSFFAVGLGLGMLHAFDPDHLAAVGGITSGNVKAVNSDKTWRYALHWSLGHGAALLVVALCVFVVGTVIPERLSAVAERSVAVVLMAIGLHALWRIHRRDMIPSKTVPSKTASPKVGYGAPLVGLLHGTAGSAPLLALIPLSQMSHPVMGLMYVLFFSAGVALAMMFIGGAMMHTFRQLNRIDTVWQSVLQVVLALFSLLLGVYLLISAG